MSIGEDLRGPCPRGRAMDGSGGSGCGTNLTFRWIAKKPSVPWFASLIEWQLVLHISPAPRVEAFHPPHVQGFNSPRW